MRWVPFLVGDVVRFGGGRVEWTVEDVVHVAQLDDLVWGRSPEGRRRACEAAHVHLLKRSGADGPGLGLPSSGGERTPHGFLLPEDMRDYQPHEHARAIGATISYRDDLPGTMVGASEPHRGFIWLHRHLGPTEGRCTLTHELVHLEAGHAGRQSIETEALVGEVVARWLVLPKVLRWALREATTPLEARALVGVDETTLRQALDLHGDDFIATRWATLTS